MRSNLKIKQCLWLYTLLLCQSFSGSTVVRASDQNLEDPGLNPGWIYSYFSNKKASNNKRIKVLISYYTFWMILLTLLKLYMNVQRSCVHSSLSIYLMQQMITCVHGKVLALNSGFSFQILSHSFGQISKSDLTESWTDSLHAYEFEAI